MAQALPIGATVMAVGPISGGVLEWTIGISGPCSAPPAQGRDPPAPAPFMVGSVVDITAMVESTGPGFYRVSMCLGGTGPCPVVLMVPGAETLPSPCAARGKPCEATDPVY